MRGEGGREENGRRGKKGGGKKKRTCKRRVRRGVKMVKVKVCGYWRKKTIFAVRTREFL